MAGQLEPRAPRINVPAEGQEARGRSEGKADQNESVSPRERTGAPLTEELSAGPNVLGNNAYGPARYRTRPRIVELKNGQSVTVDGNVREDR